MLVDLHPMTQELIETVISDEEGIVVARTQNSTPPDVLIVGRDDPELAASVLERRPRTRLLAVVDDDRETVLYQLQPSRQELGEFSRQTLVAAVRDARNPRSDWMP